MRFISHRGNIDGVGEFENSISYLEKTLELGYDVEVDIWRKNNNLYLGHDEPLYEVSIDWLIKYNNKLWLHCKHEDSLFYLKDFLDLHIFYHNDDEFTITNKNIILINPFFYTKYNNGILMMPELSVFTIDDIMKFDGIITDNIKNYENNINNGWKQ